MPAARPAAPYAVLALHSTGTQPNFFADDAGVCVVTAGGAHCLVGTVRGLALLACAAQGLPVEEGAGARRGGRV